MISDSLIELTQLLQDRGQTLALAESCTGGLLSASITKNSGVSAVFLGAVVSYSDEAKESLLNVSRENLEKFGAVSEAVAIQMAEGAKQCFGSNWSASITGVAGPTGGTAEKPVGTVCFAWAGPDFVKSSTVSFRGDRNQVQEQSASYIAEMLLSEIKSVLV